MLQCGHDSWRVSSPANTESRRRQWLLSLSFALWGLAIAVAMSGVLRRPAPPGQPVSVATLQNIDARGSMVWMLCLLLLPMILPAALRPITRRLVSGRAWARNTVIAATMVTLWLVSVHQSVPWAVLPCALVVVTSVILRDRDLHFTRRDVVLVPSMLAAFIAMIDVLPAIGAHKNAVLAALLLLALRIAVTFLPSPVAPAFAFLAAPIGLVLETGFFARHRRCWSIRHSPRC